jgi:bifunctional oligoribonuclease and PAP phosphatase NrnA
MLKEYQKARKLINSSKRILVISHRKPDADTLGGAVALKLYFDTLDKAVTLACIDKPSRDFAFLPEIDTYVDSFNQSEFDLIVIVDAGASYLTDFHLKYPDFFKTSIPILNIDHHASNDYFGKVNIVDPVAPSATVVIHRMFKDYKVDITEEMATALLAGIYGDTGGFMHSNTTKEVYDIASELMQLGADVKSISKSLFAPKSVKALKLWGKVLEGAQITDDNVVMSVVKEDDFKSIDSGPSYLSGVVDYLNMVPGTKFAVLLNEDRMGNVKGSFRTRNDNVDLSKIAAVFGGGGHPKASGFKMPGKLMGELKYTIVSGDMSKRSLKF